MFYVTLDVGLTLFLCHLCACRRPFLSSVPFSSPPEINCCACTCFSGISGRKAGFKIATSHFLTHVSRKSFRRCACSGRSNIGLFLRAHSFFKGVKLASKVTHLLERNRPCGLPLISPKFHFAFSGHPASLLPTLGEPGVLQLPGNFGIRLSFRQIGNGGGRMPIESRCALTQISRACPRFQPQFPLIKDLLNTIET